MISSKSIEEVFEIARIEDVVRDYVDLKNRGSNLHPRFQCLPQRIFLNALVVAKEAIQFNL